MNLISDIPLTPFYCKPQERRPPFWNIPLQPGYVHASAHAFPLHYKGVCRSLNSGRQTRPGPQRALLISAKFQTKEVNWSCPWLRKEREEEGKASEAQALFGMRKAGRQAGLQATFSGDSPSHSSGSHTLCCWLPELQQEQAPSMTGTRSGAPRAPYGFHPPPRVLEAEQSRTLLLDLTVHKVWVRAGGVGHARGKVVRCGRGLGWRWRPLRGLEELSPWGTRGLGRLCAQGLSHLRCLLAGKALLAFSLSPPFPHPACF